MQTLPREDFPRARSERRDERHAAASGRQGDGRENAVCDHGERHRFFLNGALFILGGRQMSLVATDGTAGLVTVDRERRQSRRRKAKKSAILPRKTLWELGKLLTEATGYSLRAGENHLFFDVGGAR
jgi:DNA polymerase III sliding clamp (beta) subunit (PCNA family)